MPVSAGSSLAAGRRGGGFSAQLCSAAWHGVPGERGGCGRAGPPVCWADALFFLPFPPAAAPRHQSAGECRSHPGAGCSAAGGHCPDRQCRLLLPPPRPGGSPVGKRLGWLARWSFGHRESPCALCQLSPPVPARRCRSLWKGDAGRAWAAREDKSPRCPEVSCSGIRSRGVSQAPF